MRFLVVFAVAGVLANSDESTTPTFDVPQLDDAPKLGEFEKHSITHAYAIDIADAMSISQMNCLKFEGYRTIFVRAFFNNSFDPNCVQNILNAHKAGLGIEIYIRPNVTAGIKAFEQVDSVVGELKKHSIDIRSIWIQVTSPIEWSQSELHRLMFIANMIERIRHHGLNVGVYTSNYDWRLITGDWMKAGDEVMLWYWHVIATGVDGETTPTFDDFRPFGGWQKPAVKQFGQFEKVCNVAANRNVYPSKPIKMEVLSKSPSLGKIRVGSIGLL
ncbi:unnamed protein product [Caenorhabditis bovis]|uniref:Uncharacterized protein n=1 Tax=Caenorhabditis bovis TaxID=2654633 RepID=A0A8S1ELP0_9PELO|nr:unnamed protein product [Caenorhabditis bovis]